MFSTRFMSNKWLAVALGLISLGAQADDGFRFFSNPEIDYWNRPSAAAKMSALIHCACTPAATLKTG